MKNTKSTIRANREADSAGIPPKRTERFRELEPTSSYVLFRMSPDWSAIHKVAGKGPLVDMMHFGKTWLEKYIDPDDQPRVTEIIRKAIRTKSMFELEHQPPLADGGPGWIFTRAVPHLDANGEIIEWYGTASDVTKRKYTEELLAEQEAKYRAVVETSADGFWMLDREGHMLMVNDAYVHRSGYSREELLTMTVAELEAAESPREVQAHIDKVIRNGTDLFETQHRTKDGKVWPVEISVSYLAVDGGLFLVFARDLTERKALKRAIVEASATEQERIGREIHDSVGQQLTAVALLASSLLSRLKAAGRTSDVNAMSEITRHIQTALAEVRELSQGLAPVELDPEGLGKTLSELVTHIAKTSGINCRFHYPRNIDLKDGSTAIHMYRLAQEAIHNAIKHAKPKHIDVRLEHADKHLILTVRDDGKGMDINLEDRGDVGLRIMHYRCSIIGGQLTIERPEDGGTLVRCAVPLRR